MKSYYIIFIAFIISHLNYAQVTQEDIGKLKELPKTYQLDVLTQKLEKNQYRTIKHTSYVVNISEFVLDHQKIYDTINKSINKDRKIDYQYNENNFLKKMLFYDFNNQLKKEVVFDYDIDNQLLFETTYNENKEEIKKITHSYDRCKEAYATNLDKDTIDEPYICETITTTNKISNYTFSVVKVIKPWLGLVKKIDLNGDKDGSIGRFYTYDYDKNEKLISADLTIGDKVRRYKTNEYNNKGNLIHMKSGFVEFFYTYKYDDFGNWTEKIETSKVKSKRTIYKQTFNY